MSSKVYFVNLRARSPRENKISKIRKLYEAAGFDDFVSKNVYYIKSYQEFAQKI